MNFEVTDEQPEALLQELSQIIDNDRYPFSLRIRTVKEIRAKIRPEPPREPLPPVRHYEPPSKGPISATMLGSTSRLQPAVAGGAAGRERPSLFQFQSNLH